MVKLKLTMIVDGRTDVSLMHCNQEALLLASWHELRAAKVRKGTLRPTKYHPANVGRPVNWRGYPRRRQAH